MARSVSSALESEALSASEASPARTHLPVRVERSSRFGRPNVVLHFSGVATGDGKVFKIDFCYEAGDPEVVPSGAEQTFARLTLEIIEAYRAEEDRRIKSDHELAMLTDRLRLLEGENESLKARVEGVKRREAMRKAE